MIRVALLDDRNAAHRFADFECHLVMGQRNRGSVGAEALALQKKR